MPTQSHFKWDGELQECSHGMNWAGWQEQVGQSGIEPVVAHQSAMAMRNRLAPVVFYLP